MRLPLQALFEQRDNPLRDPALARLMGMAYGPTAAGISVTEDSALNIAAYWRGVQLISGQLAAMPLHLYKGDKSGAKDRFLGSKLYKLLHDAPNPEMSAYSFREILQGHLLTWGNAYAEIEWNNLNQPLGLWPITPDRVTVYRDAKDLRIKYRVAPSNRIIEAEDLLHIPGLGFDGLIGYSVIARARQSLGLMAAAERYGATFFGNGAHVGGVMTIENDLDDKQEEELRAKIARQHQGPDRAHRIMLLSNVEGMKYERMSIPPNDAQFLETRKVQVVEIARWLGIPPHKLYDLERATFSNIEQQGIEYYTDTIWLWLEKWEQELNRKLIPNLETNYQWFEFDFNGVMRADTAARYNAYHMALEDGWMNRNEVRAKENLNPITDGGDIYQAQLNKIPLDQFREFVKNKLTPKPPPAALNPATDPKALEAEAQTAKDKAQRAEAAAGEARALADARLVELTELRSRAVVPAEEFAAAQQALNDARAAAEHAQGEAHERTREAARLEGLLAAEQAAHREQASRTSAAEAAVVALEASAAASRTQHDTELGAAQAALDRARVALQASRAEVTRLGQQAEASRAAVQRQARDEVALRHELTLAQDARTVAVETQTRTTADLEAQRALVAEGATREAELAAAVARAEADLAALRTAQPDSAAVLEATQALEQLRSDHAALQAAMAGLEAERSTLLAAQEVADAARRAADVSIEALTGDLTTAQATIATLEQARADAEQAHTTTRTQLAELEARVQALRPIDEGRQLESERRTITAAMRRMVQREVERVQRAAHDPKKIRAVIETFYDGYTRLLTTTLEEALDGHYTRCGRAEELTQDAARLARQHVETSQRELTTLLVGEGDLLGRVTELCERWLQVRVVAIPTEVIQREVARLASERRQALPASAPARRMKRVFERDEHGLIIASRDVPDEDAS